MTTPRELVEAMQARQSEGLLRVEAAKTRHFEERSKHRRSTADLRHISDATYMVRWTYLTAEELFHLWASAPVVAENAARYIRAGVTMHEALTVWEPRFTVDPIGTAAALDTLVGLLPRQGHHTDR
jgi:hypothetical protein